LHIAPYLGRVKLSHPTGSAAAQLKKLPAAGDGFCPFL